MSPKSYPIPAAQSGIAGQPVLRPSTAPLNVGQRAEHEAGPRILTPEVGAATAATAADSAAPPADSPTTTADKPAARTVTRTRPGGRRGAPAVADAVAMTVRVDPDEAAEIDYFILMLRQGLSRGRLDKAEVIRELLRLAMEDEVTARKLAKRLR